MQNDIAKALSRVIINYIKKEISYSPFVAIILDETSDITTKSQLTTVLRYIIEGKICERFIGFTDVSADRTANGLFKHVEQVVNEFGLQQKLVGQTYDGASVMSGHINGLQQKVINKFPLAIFTHCYAHALNLVLQQSLSSIKECQIFFKSLNGLTAFFSRSSKRVRELQQFISRKLPSVAPTRWNFTSRITKTVFKHRTQLIELFESILDNSDCWDSDTLIKSEGFLRFLNKFETIWLLEVFSKLFSYMDVLYNVLQSKMYEVLYCAEKIEEFLRDLQHERNHGFDGIWSSTVECEDNAISERERERRNSNESDTKTYCSALFSAIIDNMSEQIKTRYASLSKLDFFQLLWPTKYNEFKAKFPIHFLNKLQTIYGPLFDYIRLENELYVLYRSNDFVGKHAHELITFIKSMNLQPGFSEVYKLCQLICTIRSNTASAERSFSALKRINTCFRCRQHQERLSGLSLIAFEKSIVIKLKNTNSLYDLTIEQFLSQKRRIELIYK